MWLQCNSTAEEWAIKYYFLLHCGSLSHFRMLENNVWYSYEIYGILSRNADQIIFNILKVYRHNDLFKK